jgi:hypothetical protein
MKKWYMLPTLLLFISVADAQVNDPVKWAFSSQKIGDNTFELHFTANIQSPWHIYARGTNEELGMPTTISINKNPLIEVNGQPKEIGNPQEKKIDGVLIKYFPGKVEFIQVVRLKAAVKTNVSGKVDYMACTDSHCLPPVQRGFSVSLDNKQ